MPQKVRPLLAANARFLNRDRHIHAATLATGRPGFGKAI